MSWEEIGYATRIDGNMDADLYVAILDDELKLSMEKWGASWAHKVFQQDNDCKHTSRKTKNYFEEHDIPVMKWPAQSPDLNPIEHLWNHLKRKLGEYEEPPRGMTELWERTAKEWNAIPKEVVQNLIESMPRRVEAVIEAKGGYIKY